MLCFNKTRDITGITRTGDLSLQKRLQTTMQVYFYSTAYHIMYM